MSGVSAAAAPPVEVLRQQKGFNELKARLTEQRENPQGPRSDTHGVPGCHDEAPRPQVQGCQLPNAPPNYGKNIHFFRFLERKKELLRFSWPHKLKMKRADYGARTRDHQLKRLALYRLS